MKNYSKMYDEPEFTTTAEFIEEVEVVEDTPQTPIRIGIVNAREVYIREDAGFEHPTMGTVKKDDELIIYNEINRFYQVETPDGRNGYIDKDYVNLID